MTDPETQNQLNEIQGRITEVSEAAIVRNGELDKRIERLAATAEESGRNQTRIEETVQINATHLGALEKMHDEFLKENRHTCVTVDKAVDIALVAREKAEDVEAATNPIISDYKERMETKGNWKKVVWHVIKVLSAAAVLWVLASFFGF